MTELSCSHSEVRRREFNYGCKPYDTYLRVAGNSKSANSIPRLFHFNAQFTFVDLIVLWFKNCCACLSNEPGRILPMLELLSKFVALRFDRAHARSRISVETV